MVVGYKTDPGLIRKNNEDQYTVEPDIGLMIVADGMGGHQGGEVASNLAVKIVASEIKEGLKINLNDQSEIIRTAVKKADEVIYNKAQRDKSLEDMGTTIVIALCKENDITIAHVGDSRVYLINKNNIKQITMDHSAVSELVQIGEITQEEARRHHLKHVITRALGIKNSAEPDIQTLQIRKEEYLLLCTDGLTDMLEDDEIMEIILKDTGDLEQTCENLIARANKRGGRDNITIILAKLD